MRAAIEPASIDSGRHVDDDPLPLRRHLYEGWNETDSHWLSPVWPALCSDPQCTGQKSSCSTYHWRLDLEGDVRKPLDEGRTRRSASRKRKASSDLDRE
jgi:hypothetical protein